MRRIVAWVLSTISVLVLLFSYHTSTSSTLATVQTPGPSDDADSMGSSAGATPSASSAPPSASASPGSPAIPTPTQTRSTASTTTMAPSATASLTPTKTATSTKIAGTAVATRFGNVQVQITVLDKRITAATVLQIPNRESKDVQINGYAVPILNAETVKAQSAAIDMVSGATVTSSAYIQSLQSAIDKAHL